jgi:hypothetical protein
VAAARGQAPSIFISDVSPTNILTYIHRFYVTDEYILIFLGIEEYKELYLLVLRSSVILLVNRGIYNIFLIFVGIFVGCNRQIYS